MYPEYLFVYLNEKIVGNFCAVPKKSNHMTPKTLLNHHKSTAPSQNPSPPN